MKKQLHPAVKISWRISRYITAIFFTIFLLVGIGTYVLELLDSSGVTSFSGAVKAFTFMFLFIFIIFVVITEIWVRLLYNRWFYEFTSSSLKLERGVIIKRYSDVPYERIQNVDIRRGIIARIFGFSSVIIHPSGPVSPLST